MWWLISIAAGNLVCAGLYYLTLRTRLFRVRAGARAVGRSAGVLFGPAFLGAATGGGLAPGASWLMGVASVLPAFLVIPFTLLLGGAAAAIPRGERPHFFGIIGLGIALTIFTGLVGGVAGGLVRGLTGEGGP